MADLLGWLLLFFFLIFLLAIMGYQLMCLADLEFDYINPYDSAVRINNVVLPEYVLQGVSCVVFLLTRHWLMFLLSLPFLCYNVRQYKRKQHMIDVTEIYNQLNWEKKQRLVKLFYLLFLLVVALFCLLWSVGRDDY